MRLALLNTGSLQAWLYLEDGVADVACVSGPAVPPAEGMTVIGSRKRELGLIFREGRICRIRAACAWWAGTRTRP